MKRKRIIGIFLLSLITGCGPYPSGNNRKFSGTLEMTEHSLGAKAGGRLQTLNVQEGDEVKKGQVIAVMDRYEQAVKDFGRLQRAQKGGGISEQDVEYAALTVDDQSVVSPVDGIVLVKVHDVGEVVPAGAPVVIVGDRKDFWVRIYVPEGVVNTIRLQQSATLYFDGVSKSLRGWVSYIALQAEFTPRNVQTQEERVTQVFAVKVSVDDPLALVHPGVAVDVVLESQD